MAKTSYLEKLAAWQQRRDSIKALRESGLSLTVIGKKLRISRQRVGQLLRKA